VAPRSNGSGTGEHTEWDIYYVRIVQSTGEVTGPFISNYVAEIFVCDSRPEIDGNPRDFSRFPKIDYPNGCPTVPVDHDKNLGAKNCAGNPINIALGNKFQEEVDYARSGTLVWELKMAPTPFHAQSGTDGGILTSGQ
jgi:hypothetical protein